MYMYMIINQVSLENKENIDIDDTFFYKYFFNLNKLNKMGDRHFIRYNSFIRIIVFAFYECGAPSLAQSLELTGGQCHCHPDTILTQSSVSQSEPSVAGALTNQRPVSLSS